MKQGDKISIAHIMRKPDLITFQTAYIGEREIYDHENDAIIRCCSETNLSFKRFTAKDFNIKQVNPCEKLREQPHVMLSYGVDVISMYFSYEIPLNKIIKLYDSKGPHFDLHDKEINQILLWTQQISPHALVFHAEKLISLLLNIFCKT